MRGKILNYDDTNGQGLISGDDGQRYSFVRGDLQGGVRAVATGSEVDFQGEGEAAKSVYVVGRAPGEAGEKSKVAAALLALFLGLLGVHKFYLGKPGAGVIMLLCGTVGWLLFGIPAIIIGIVAFIEFIIYLVKSEQDFQRDYVEGNRAWF